MDSNAAAKLLRPPSKQGADDELPAPAAPAPAPAESSGRQRTLSGTRLRATAVLALLSDYLRIVSQNLKDDVWRIRVHGDDDAAGDKLALRLWWRVPALLALAYAVIAALIWFIGRLERRRRLLQPAVDRDARWEGRLKLAAQILVGLLLGYSYSLIPCAFFVFMWVKSDDQVYIKVEKEEESDEEKQISSIGI